MIEQYLIREISKPFLTVCVLLITIFASYSLSLYLADAANGLLPPNKVLILVLLKTMIALEVLLPIALYLAVIVGLGRLHADSEMTALAALGWSDVQVLKAVLYLTVTVALLVALLSLFGRPWAYGESYRLRAEAAVAFDLEHMESGRFYESQQAKRVIYAESRTQEGQTQRLTNVFLQIEQDTGNQVLFARHAVQTEAQAVPELQLQDGYAYVLGDEPGFARILKFRELTLRLRAAEKEYKRKAESTLELAQSGRSMDIAEFQWRLSTPLATLLLSLIGVPLSRAAPRQGKYAKLVVAVLVYAGFFNLSALAKTWVEQEVVAAIPGIWWANGLLAVLLAVLLLRPGVLRR